MLFQALTSAPMLREGATLNFMAVPQGQGASPALIAAGDRVTLRFGHCCPLIREGQVVEMNGEGLALSIDGDVWALELGTTGIEIPGIVSRDWIISHRVAGTTPRQASHVIEECDAAMGQPSGV